MKNAIVLGLVAVCCALISSNPVNAAVVGGGGGKTSSKARVTIISAEPDNGIGIANWIRPKGTALPKTMGELRSKLIYVGPGQTRTTAKLKNGTYEYSIVDAADTAIPDDTILDPDAIQSVIIDHTVLELKGKDRKAEVSEDYGIELVN